MIRALVLDDKRDFVTALGRSLSGIVEVVPAYSVAEGKHLLGPEVSLALVDLYLTSSTRGEPEGLGFIKWLRETRPDVDVIVISGHGSFDLAVEALRLGAVDFLDKGQLSPEKLRLPIEKLIERRGLQSRVKDLEARLENYEPRRLTGSDPLIQQARRLLLTAASDARVTVLLRGESGTGKELAARMIHREGPRQKGPFVAVDVSTLPRDTLASELFGYERGAFTGAEKQHVGYLEAAHGGVLFLDEIAELPRDVQGSLFRVLEERAVVRLGSTKPRAVDIQLVAATNQDLETLVAAGEFRKELYYRLKVFEIVMPPLRERPGDIPEIVDFFLDHWRLTGRSFLRTVPVAVMHSLQKYRWPGNVRELRNALEAASVQSRPERATVLDARFLPPGIMTNTAPAVLAAVNGALRVEEATAQAELAAVARALELADGNKNNARELLGYGDRHTMRRRLLNIRSRFPELWQHYPALESLYPSPRSGKRTGTPREL